MYRDSTYGPCVDTLGPGGNAFTLMGVAGDIARQMGMEPGAFQSVLDDMTSGDYDHLLAVFHREFGDLVTLTRDGAPVFKFEFDEGSP